MVHILPTILGLGINLSHGVIVSFLVAIHNITFEGFFFYYLWYNTAILELLHNRRNTNIFLKKKISCLRLWWWSFHCWSSYYFLRLSTQVILTWGGWVSFARVNTSNIVSEETKPVQINITVQKVSGNGFSITTKVEIQLWARNTSSLIMLNYSNLYTENIKF